MFQQSRVWRGVAWPCMVHSPPSHDTGTFYRRPDVKGGPTIREPTNHQRAHHSTWEGTRGQRLPQHGSPAPQLNFSAKQPVLSTGWMDAGQGTLPSAVPASLCALLSLKEAPDGQVSVEQSPLSTCCRQLLFWAEQEGAITAVWGRQISSWCVGLAAAPRRLQHAWQWKDFFLGQG